MWRSPQSSSQSTGYPPYRKGSQRLRLRSSGVEHEHANRAELPGDRGDQLADLLLICDVGAEGIRGTAAATDTAGDLARPRIAAAAIDRDGQAVVRQPPRNHRPQAP